MLALYRAGRQADALEVYQQTRRAFLDDLGLEPSEELQRLQRAILEHDPALGPAPRNVWPRARRALRRPRVLAVLGAALLAGALGVAAVTTLNRAETAAALGAEPDSVVFLEPTTGKLVAQAPVRRSEVLRFGEGFLWSSNADGTLDQVDPRTHVLVKRIPVGVHPGDVAVGEGAVWVTDEGSQTLLRVDPRYGTVDRIRLPSDGLRDAAVPSDVAVGAESVWVAHGNSEVLRIDPATGVVRRRYAIPYASRVSFAEGAVWVDMLDARIAVSRIDPGTNAVTRPVPWSHAYGCCTAVGGGSIWVATDDDHTIWKFDPILGDQVGKVELPGEVSDIAYGAGALWVATGRTGTVVRIDPLTTRTRSFNIGHAVSSLAVAGFRLAVAVRPRAMDVTAGLTGRIARLPMFNDWIETTDPAVTGGGMPYRLQLRIRHVRETVQPSGRARAGRLAARARGRGGAAVGVGRRAQPDGSDPRGLPLLATAERAGDGRHVPPHDRARAVPGVGISRRRDRVPARDRRRGRVPRRTGGARQRSQRARRHAHDPPHQPRPRPGRTPGAAAVLRRARRHPGRARRARAADPLRRSLLRLRLLPRRSARRQAQSQLPRAAPASARRDRVRVRRQGRGLGPPGRAQRERGARGLLPVLGPNGALAGRYDHASDAGPRRFFLPPHLSNVYLAFNTRRPLFALRRVRQAVNYALDRQAIAAPFEYLPAGHYLPPGVPGHRTTHVYPVRPDLRRARALIQDDGGTALLYICDCNEARAWAQIIRRNLARIGIRVRLREYEARSQILVAGTCAPTCCSRRRRSASHLPMPTP